MVLPSIECKLDTYYTLIVNYINKRDTSRFNFLDANGSIFLSGHCMGNALTRYIS